MLHYCINTLIYAIYSQFTISYVWFSICVCMYLTSDECSGVNTTTYKSFTMLVCVFLV